MTPTNKPSQENMERARKALGDNGTVIWRDTVAPAIAAALRSKTGEKNP